MATIAYEPRRPNIATANVQLPAVRDYEQVDEEISATLRPTKIWFLLLLIAMAFLAIPAAWAGDYTGNVNFVLGQKYLDKDDWEPLEEQGEFAALVSWGGKSWPVQIAIDVLGSYKKKTTSGYVDGIFFDGDLEGSVHHLGGEDGVLEGDLGGNLAPGLLRNIDARQFEVGSGSIEVQKRPASDGGLPAWSLTAPLAAPALSWKVSGLLSGLQSLRATRACWRSPRG